MGVPEPAATHPLLPRLAPLLAAMALGFLAVSMPLPVLPLHVARTLGLGPAVAGLAVGLQSFATILTRPASGRLVDARGPKATLAGGLVIASAAGWITLLSVPLRAAGPWPSLAVLLGGRLVLGVGESLLITGVLAWAIVRSGPGRAGAAMSWNGMAQYGALALGAPAGFALGAAHGFGAVALATAVAPLLALAPVLRLEPAAPLGGTRLPLRSVVGAVARPGSALMLAGIGFAAVSTFGALAFAARGWAGAGFALTAYGGAFVAVRLVAAGLPDRLGGWRVAAGCLVVETAGQLLLWLAPAPAVALAGAALTGAGCSLVFPALGVEAVRRVPAESRGVAIGAFAAFQDLAIGATGPVLGTLAAGQGPAAVFMAGALAAGAGVLVAVRALRAG